MNYLFRNEDGSEVRIKAHDSESAKDRLLMNLGWRMNPPGTFGKYPSLYPAALRQEQLTGAAYEEATD